MKLAFIPSVFLLCLSLCSYGQCTTRLLNEQWNFRFSHQVEPHTAMSVTLPHTWNAQDALSGKIDYKRGMCNYEHLLYIASEWKGKRLFLRFDGVSSIADVFINGKYVGEHHEEDVRLMLEIGVNAVCLAHYQQVEAIYGLMDKAGIVVWSEIPFVGPGGYLDKGFVDSASFRENGKEQLLELIRQNYNHPFICFWGLFNELKKSGDNPIPYVEALNALAHLKDPVRLTTSASNQEGAWNFIPDCIAWNQYDGLYDGMSNALGPFWDRTHVEYPDFAWASVNMGRKGINYKGIVAFDRKVRKDAFYFYKANLNPEPKFNDISQCRRRFGIPSGIGGRNVNQCKTLIFDKNNLYP